MKAVEMVPTAHAVQPQRRSAAAFRLRLLVTLMVVVLVVTGLALYFAQRNLQAEYVLSSHDEFQSRLGFLLGEAEARQSSVSDRCRSLARSVRIRAALEEDDLEDLYQNGRIELRDILAADETPGRASVQGTGKATFFRFLNASGGVLSENETPLQPWESQLAASNPKLGRQQIGFISIPAPNGDTGLEEVVSTPIFGPDGAVLGALVLGFPPIDFAGKSDTHEIRNGLWLKDQLFMPGMQEVDRKALLLELGKEIAREERSPRQERDNISVQIHGESNLLFYKILNPGSSYPPAYQLSLYSLAASLAEQQKLRWQIIGAALLILAVGLVGSHFLAIRLARPVEQLAEDSAENLVLREKAEAARERTEKKYQSIFENAVEGIFLLSTSGQFLSANPALARIYGYDSPEELIEKLTHPTHQLYLDPSQGAEFLRCAEATGTVSDFEAEVRRKNGETIWISQNVRCVRDAGGVLSHLEGTLEDITHRKQSEDALQTLNAELGLALSELKATQQQIIQQERLRALGQMASGVAHDFNNALMPIMGYTELLIEIPGMLDDRQKALDYLQIIRTGANDAASVVARLREFYRSNEAHTELVPVNLRLLANQIVALTKPKWKDQAQSHGAEIQIHEELNEVPPISGDEAALREVLTNLIFNAVDAMPKGGAITLRTRSEGGRVFIEVADTGTGMTEDVRRQCLEPFFSTKGERGTGLGLSMVFGIVQRHDGMIDILSTLGKGTTFVVSFPILAPGEVSGKISAVEQTQSSHKILIVEDEPQIRDVLSTLLEMEGHTVQTAENGIEGLRCFRNGKFDLVITDKAMPGMSGDQMAVAIKQLSPSMPVVLLSGFNSISENEHIPGVDIVAGKPITLAALRSAIGKAMELSL